MKQQEIRGYKAFNPDMTNRYKIPFEEGKTYEVAGKLSFGNQGNGYHFCKNLEDTLRYVNTAEPVKIAEVTSLDEVVTYNDDYYGYYDMYAARKLRIDKILERKEIINRMLNVHEDRAIRFISLFNLTESEKDLFKLRYQDNLRIYLAMQYFFENDLEIYKRFYQGKVKIKIKDDE